MPEVVKNFTKKHSIAALVARGYCMGAADIVPGVSGGTMAFIMGIYEELIDAIRTFATKEFWDDVFHLRFVKAIKRGRWGFLIPLGSGIVLAALSLSHSLEYLLKAHPLLVWSFFFGLIVASVYFVAIRIRVWSTSRYTLLILGAVCGFLIVGLVPVETPAAWWFFILSGAIAICAMILPGISGSFLLLILGKYEQILTAVNERDFAIIAYVGIGAAAGLIAFSQFLSWLLHKHHDSTVAFLTGLMVGSLRRVWPWKAGEGLLEHNVLPSLFQNGSVSMSFVSSIGLILLGALLVYAIERIASRSSH